MTDSWTRGREAPMQWEFTSPRPSFPQHDSTQPIVIDSPQMGDDDTLPDVSMAILDDEDRGADDSAEVQEIPRPSSVPETASRSAKGQQQLIRRRNHVGSGEDDEDEGDETQETVVNQWAIPPMVGTVINYLVPPIDPQQQQQQQQQQRQQPSTPDASIQAQHTLHPRERPLVLLNYAQLVFNVAILSLAIAIIFAGAWIIVSDVLERLKEIEDAYHHGIATCKRNFDLNCLATSPLPPALVQPCQDWAACSQKKLSEAWGGSRLRVVIEVLSEAWEVGVAGLGWRTLAFSLCLLAVFVGKANSALTGLRSGVQHKVRDEQVAPVQPPPPQQQQQQALPPPSQQPTAWQPTPQMLYSAAQHQQQYYHPAVTPSRRSNRTRNNNNHVLLASPRSNGRLRGGSGGGGSGRQRGNADTEWIELSD